MLLPQIINYEIVHVQREISGIFVLASKHVTGLCLHQWVEWIHGLLLRWGGLIELVVDTIIPCQLEINDAACPMLASI
jgi:hypothetical protein